MDPAELAARMQEFADATDGQTGEAGADLRNFEPGAHVHQHPHRHPGDGTIHGEPHVHTHSDPAHDHLAAGASEYDANLANEYGAIELGFPDLSGLGATPAEIGALLDVLSEPDTYNGYDEDQAAADQVDAMSDAEFAEMLAEYEADRSLPGPELAGADAGNVIDLAGSMSDIDRMLSAMASKEHQRQAEDAAERGHRRGSTEIRLSAAMRRLDAGSYVYGQADLANDPDIDGLFSAGPSLNRAEVADAMRYELCLGAKPQGRGQFRPPVRDLAARIGLR